MTLHVYGVVTSGADPVRRLTGRQGRPVREVAHGDLAALVSEVDPAAPVAGEDLLSHARVLEQISADVDVVPLRFATLVSDEAELQDAVLEGRRSQIADLLHRFAGTVQVTVKGFHVEEQALRDVMSGAPDLVAARNRVAGLPGAAAYYDQIALGERINHLLERLRAGDARQVLARLAPAAIDVAEEATNALHQFLSAAFLVRRTGIDAFSNAVAGVAEHAPARYHLRYVGPQPPYAFIPSEGRASAWA